jgi:hypothetical protein
VITGQLLDLANELPKYKNNLVAKVGAFKRSPNSPIDKVTKTLQEVTSEMAKPDTAPVVAEPAASDPSTPEDAKENTVPGAADAPSESTGTASPEAAADSAAQEAAGPAARVAPAPPAVPVQVVERADNPFDLLKSVIAPIAGPLGNAAIVIVFVIFMLIGREDLRDRVIHLIGRHQLHVTTQALDDAAHRVSRYLLAQLIVNVTYGIPIGLGLYFIGIPNAVLWGLMATVLRFIPYIGPWIAASFPVALSLAVSPSWNAPLLTLGLFVVVELISNNVVEPWLYGSSTGLSPMAIIVSAGVLDLALGRARTAPRNAAHRLYRGAREIYS